jgi:hypothetical protein
MRCIRSFQVLATVVLLVEGVSAMPQHSDFEQILRDPMRFAGKHIVISGVAQIYDDRFFLYLTAAAAQNAKLSQSVFVVTSPDAKRYEKLDNHWLQIFGTVDPAEHGPFGGAACGLLLDSLKVLNYPVVHSLRVDGVIHNETSEPVRVQVSDKRGYSLFVIQSGGVHTLAIDSSSVAAVESISGHALAKAVLIRPALAKSYLDQARHAYFYRIVDGRIDPVAPSIGKKWPTASPE